MTTKPLTVMGFDYGSKRIGVAIGQTLTATASPLGLIRVNHLQPDWTRIGHLLQEWRPDALVVGIPHHKDGSDNAITKAASRFSRQLQERYHLPIHTVDEAFTSVVAANARKQGINAELDAIAAQLILESWLAQCP